jgi:hypothetical protein
MYSKNVRIGYSVGAFDGDKRVDFIFQAMI